MKIVILDGHPVNPGDLSWERFQNLGALTVYDRTPAETVVERIGEAEVILTGETPITAEMIKACPKLRYIGVLSTGYNTVEVDATKARGILVCNVPNYGTEAVAQFAIALLLEICHHVGAHSDAVRGGRWENSRDWCFWDYPLIELAHKTIGLIGFGRIGQATGRIAKALGMRVIACDEMQNDTGREIGAYVSLNELLAESDVISLHCPQLPSTVRMINKDTIAKMKDGVILINTSRGALIAEQDLADGLNSGKVYAAVDVVSKEPIAGSNPLLRARNCLITPHIAWAPRESRARLMDITADNLAAFIAGDPIHVVNW